MVKLLRLSRMYPLRLAYTPSPNIQWTFVWLRVLPLTFLTLVALIPTQYYITEDRLGWLPIMAIILFLPRPILALRTMVIAIGAVNDEMRTNRWDVLILTGIPARKIVWSKWLLVVRQTAFDHFVYNLPHIGLALAVAEYLNVNLYYIAGKQMWQLVINPYSYDGYSFYRVHAYPSPITFIIGSIVIGLFALFECGLVSSIGLIGAFAAKKISFLTSIKCAAIFAGVILTLFFGWVFIWAGSGWQGYSRIVCYPITYYPCNSQHYKTYARITDTIQIAGFVPIDQGTLLAANIMRPFDNRMLELKSYEPMRQTQLYKSPYDNRPFVARNVFAALLSVGLYALIIRYFLRCATRFAIINHGASGYLEL